MEPISDVLIATLTTIAISSITAFIVACINNRMQFFGKLRMYATFITHTEIPIMGASVQGEESVSKLPTGELSGSKPPASKPPIGEPPASKSPTGEPPDSKPPTGESPTGKMSAGKPPRIKYEIRCLCFNSKSVPIYLENFHVEMKVRGSQKAKVIQITNVEPVEVSAGNFRVSANTAVPEQMILPRVIHEFRFKLNTDGAVAEISQLKLVCYDEKHKKHTFLLKKGVRWNQIGDDYKKHCQQLLDQWHQDNEKHQS